MLPKPRRCVWMHSEDDWPSELLTGACYPIEQPLESHGRIDVLCAMQGRREVSLRFEAQSRQDRARVYRDLVALDHLKDRVPDHEDTLARDALSQEILFTAMGVGHEHGAAVIDDPPVDLFWHTPVVASVAGLEMVDGDPASRRHHRRQSAIRVAEDQEPVRADALEHVTHPPDDQRRLLGKLGRPYAKMNLRGAQSQFSKEHIAEILVVILARVDEDLITKRVEMPDDLTQPNNLGASPEQRHDSHSVSATGDSWRCSRRRARNSSSSTTESADA